MECSHTWAAQAVTWLSYSLGSECPEREVVDLIAQEKYVRLDRRDNRPECASCNLAEAHLQSNLPPESMECQLRQIFLCS